MERFQHYYIDSSKRTSGTDGHFSYELRLPPDNNFDHVCLLQCNIPVSYYLIQDGFNYFYLREYDKDTRVEIPVGNYTANSFKNVVGQLLNDMSPHHWTYKMEIPNAFITTSTAKYTFQVAGNDEQPSLVFASAKESTVYQQFGFSPGSVNTFENNMLLSTNIVDFINEHSIFIHSDIIQCDNNDVLQEVYSSNTSPLSNIAYICPNYEQCSKRLRTNKSSTYTFAITDEDGIEMDFNGINVIMTIVLYKKDDTMKKLLNYFKYRLLQEQQASALQYNEQ